MRVIVRKEASGATVAMIVPGPAARKAPREVRGVDKVDLKQRLLNALEELGKEELPAGE